MLTPPVALARPYAVSRYIWFRTGRVAPPVLRSEAVNPAYEMTVGVSGASWPLMFTTPPSQPGVSLTHVDRVLILAPRSDK